MKIPTVQEAIRGVVLTFAVTALSIQVARAHPYASGITNNGGTIFFILNESADTVGVSFPQNNSTNFLGANLAAGPHSFTLGPGTNQYRIYVVSGRKLLFWEAA